MHLSSAYSSRSRAPGEEEAFARGRLISGRAADCSAVSNYGIIDHGSPSDLSTVERDVRQRVLSEEDRFFGGRGDDAVRSAFLGTTSQIHSSKPNSDTSSGRTFGVHSAKDSLQGAQPQEVAEAAPTTTSRSSGAVLEHPRNGSPLQNGQYPSRSGPTSTVSAFSFPSEVLPASSFSFDRGFQSQGSDPGPKKGSSRSSSRKTDSNSYKSGKRSLPGANPVHVPIMEQHEFKSKAVPLFRMEDPPYTGTRSKTTLAIPHIQQHSVGLLREASIPATAQVRHGEQDFQAALQGSSRKFPFRDGESRCHLGIGESLSGGLLQGASAVGPQQPFGALANGISSPGGEAFDQESAQDSAGSVPVGEDCVLRPSGVAAAPAEVQRLNRRGIDRDPLELLMYIFQNSSVKTVKSIPIPCRSQVALELGKLMASATDPRTRSVSLWVDVLIFPLLVLHDFPSGDTRYKLNQKKRALGRILHINANLRAFLAGGDLRQGLIDTVTSLRRPGVRPSITSDAKKINRCLKLCREDGQYAKAMASLSDSMAIAPQTQDTLAALQLLHPRRSANVSVLSPQVDLAEDPFTCLENDILLALQSFSKGSAGGRSGLRPNHLSELVAPCAHAPRFLEALCSFVNVLASGKAPPQLAPFLASAPLTPLMKKDRTIRPVAVGETLRRLVSKIAMAKVKHRAASLLAPLQLGVGMRDGCEAIIHVFNRLLRDPHLPPDCYYLLLDFINAFNSVDRQAFYDATVVHFPELAYWVFYCYGCDAYLFYGLDFISSQVGVQQGDPLGPLLFALAIQPLLLHIKAHTACLAEGAFLDDISVVVSSRPAALDLLNLIQVESAKIGLSLSLSKSILWCPRDCVGSSLDLTVPSYPLLGVPLLGGVITSSIPFSTEFAKAKATKAALAIGSLRTLGDPQVALLLLRYCLGMPKLYYLLRTTTSPSLLPSIPIIDTAIRDSLQWIVVGDGPGFGPKQLDIASLPLRFGGLGITLAADAVKYCFLASCLSSLELQSQISPTVSTCMPHLTSSFHRFLAHSHPYIPSDAPSVTDILLLPKIQSILAECWFRKKRRSLLMMIRDSGDRMSQQHILILTSRCIPRLRDDDEQKNAPGIKSIASDFLLAMPCAGLNQALSPLFFRLALKFYTLTPLKAVTTACNRNGCTHLCDIYGYHPTACQAYDNLSHARHQIIGRCLTDISHAAGFISRQDPRGVLCVATNSQGQLVELRPADVCIGGLDEVMPFTAVDVTVGCPLTVAKEGTLEGKVPGKLACKAAQTKMNKNEKPCHDANMAFIPFSLDVLGNMEQKAVLLLKRLASAYASLYSMPYSYVLSLFRRRVSVALQRGIAKQMSFALDFVSLAHDPD